MRIINVLLYINDINQNITSTIRLLADDWIMYRTVSAREEANMILIKSMTGVKHGKCNYKIKCAMYLEM